MGEAEKIVEAAALADRIESDGLIAVATDPDLLVEATETIIVAALRASPLPGEEIGRVLEEMRNLLPVGCCNGGECKRLKTGYPQRDDSCRAHDLKVAFNKLVAALSRQPAPGNEADPTELTALHIKLLRRGASGQHIGLSDFMGVHMGEVAALGELTRMGLVEDAKGPFPPGPPSLTPSVITEAGRKALAALTRSTTGEPDAR